MILKKFYGPTINDAMRTAKQQLGEGVVLLESVPPEGKRPACITVMVDDKLDKTSDEEPLVTANADDGFRNVFYKRSDVLKPATVKASQIEGSVFPNMDDALLDDELEEGFSENEPLDEPTVERKELPMSRRGKQLISVPELDEQENQRHIRQAYATDSVSREVTALHRRFDQLESMLSETLISANLDYASHPAFQQLLDSGLRATTVSGWFKQILNSGFDPYDDHESFMFQLAKIVRETLTITMPTAPVQNMIFVGPSGSGKTSIIMKLVTNEEFMKGQNVAIVSVEPRNLPKRYTILEPFAQDYDVPFYRVKDGIDVSKLIPKLSEYDHVLFDTPPVSLEKKTAFREYWKLRQILAPVVPVEVHFVINATMENYYFREAYATNHPLQPDYVAITHLDETSRWGHLIPFLKTLGCSVRYMGMGQSVPEDISAFSPTWFAEKILTPHKA